MQLHDFDRISQDTASRQFTTRISAVIAAATSTLFCLVLLLLMLGPAGAAEEDVELKFRTWTDSTGTHETEAALLRYKAGSVHLQKRDGKPLTVAMDRLSRSDQSYVKQELTRRALRRRKQRDKGKPEPETKPEEPSPSKPDEPVITQASRPIVTLGDWPGWRGPLRDGKSSDTGLLKEWPEGGPKLLWTASGIGSGYSTVAVHNGIVYATGDLGGQLMVFALDRQGKIAWRNPCGRAWTGPSPGSRSTPTLDSGRLYLVTGDGTVGCLDARSGRPVWNRQMTDMGGGVPQWGYSESVLIVGKMAIVTPGGTNCIVALDKSNGEPIWTSRGFRAGAQYSSNYAFFHDGVPMIANGTSEGIVCVAPEDGRTLWANPFSAKNTANCPTPAFADGYVFWANGYNKGGICLKLTVEGKNVSAEEAWTTKDMVCQHGGYIIHEGHIYGNHAGGWACLDLKTGQQKWSEQGVGKGSLCFADGMLYLFSEREGLAGLATCSPDAMEMKGTFNVQGQGTSWAYPVVIGGRLYLRYDQNLYCFDVKASEE